MFTSLFGKLQIVKSQIFSTFAKVWIFLNVQC